MDKSQMRNVAVIAVAVVAVLGVVYLYGRELMPRGKVQLSSEQVQQMQKAMGQHGPDRPAGMPTMTHPGGAPGGQ